MAAFPITRSSRCCPAWALAPMVGLATAATVIASQAVISGAFSLARQAVQLNILPRIEVQHTSETQSGQIYMPRVNLLLALGVMLLVVGFGESSSLASAYGISVTGEMLMTTILLFIVMRRLWKWQLARRADARRDLRHHRSRLLLRQCGKGARRRLGVDRRRRLMGLIMVTWVQGHALPLRQDPQERDSARFPGRADDQETADAGARHGGVPDQRPAQRADRADAQPQALQGAARAECHPFRRDRPAACGARQRAGQRWNGSTTCSCG